jgi:hypothetical protein
VPLLQAFNSPERSKKSSANFPPFQSKSSYLQAAEQSDFVSAMSSHLATLPLFLSIVAPAYRARGRPPGRFLAAKLLRLGQPAVSKTIAQLEERPAQ